jgi:hypothetical protein
LFHWHWIGNDKIDCSTLYSPFDSWQFNAKETVTFQTMKSKAMSSSPSLILIPYTHITVIVGVES